MRIRIGGKCLKENRSSRRECDFSPEFCRPQRFGEQFQLPALLFDTQPFPCAMLSAREAKTQMSGLPPRLLGVLLGAGLALLPGVVGAAEGKIVVASKID